MLFVRDYLGWYASVGVGMFKYLSLLGTSPLPPLYTIHVYRVNMISYVGQLSTVYDPRVILDPLEVESYEATLSLSLDEISCAMI